MKVKYDFNPFGAEYAGVTVKGSKRQQILDELKDYIKTRVLQDVGGGESPVEGKGKFPALSKKSGYREFKQSVAGNTKANLELYGDLLDSVTVDEIKGGSLRLTVSDDQQAKADNHNKFSGKSKGTKVPERRFIPNAKDGDVFRKSIKDGIAEIIQSFLDDEES